MQNNSKNISLNLWEYRLKCRTNGLFVKVRQECKFPHAIQAKRFKKKNKSQRRIILVQLQVHLYSFPFYHQQSLINLKQFHVCMLPQIDVILFLRYNQKMMLREELTVDVGPAEQEHAKMEQLQVEIMEPQERKRSKVFTKSNILIILAVLAIAAIGTTYLLSSKGKEEGAKSGIALTHDKIISHAESSKSEGSNTGSSTSKSSNGNTKPNAKSLPASKGIISSHPGLNNVNGDEPDPNDEDDGEKRDRKLKKGSSQSGGSTEEDSSEEDEDDSMEEEIYWVDTKLEGNEAPLVGNSRHA